MSIIFGFGGTRHADVTNEGRPAMMAGAQRNTRIPWFGDERDTGVEGLYR
jgi:hypothetical protein